MAPAKDGKKTEKKKEKKPRTNARRSKQSFKRLRHAAAHGYSRREA